MATPLCETYDVAMLDLDGVVYVGQEAVPGAAEHLSQARSRGLRLAFVTNNAARPPSAVADHLRELGVEATDDDVVTSAQAAARVLLDRLGGGARVALLGGEGLDLALREVGLVPVGTDEDAEAVVSGYGPEVRWREVMDAAVRIRDGSWWVASNTDGTIPTAGGIAPGHGALVDLLRRFTDVEPTVAGKPSRPLLEETMRRTGATRPLMVGDRIDTDIEGARAVDVDSLLVMTGVTGPAELANARPEQRPTFVAADLGALLEPAGDPRPVGDSADSWALGGWTTSIDDGAVSVHGSGSASDWWRVVAAHAWKVLDRTGDPADLTGLEVPGVHGGDDEDR